MDITEALYDRLTGYANLTTLLAVYKSSPAVFTSAPVPVDAPRPFVVSAGSVSEPAFEGLNFTGQTVRRDVFAYADNDGSAKAVEAIARQIRAALNRARLTVPGGQVIQTRVTGGGDAPTDSSLNGRFVTVEIVGIDS